MVTVLIHCRERIRSMLHLSLLTLSLCRRQPRPARNRKSNSRNQNKHCEKDRYVWEKGALLEFAGVSAGIQVGVRFLAFHQKVYAAIYFRSWLALAALM